MDEIRAGRIAPARRPPVSPDDSSASGEDAGSSPPVRSRDIWRAARARRKALRSEIRRFTRATRRRRLIWFGSIGAVLALVLVSVAAAYSPLFSLQRITVAGTSALDRAEIEAALADQLGTPLGFVDENAVREALAAFPLIESYSLEARPPHELTVRIVERTPVGVIHVSGGYTLVDAAGVALATTAERPSGEPVIQAGQPGSPSFTAAGLVVRSLPEPFRSDLESVSATTPYDVTLLLASGIEVRWGSAEDSALKAIVLGQTMNARPTAQRIDVSSPEAVVVG